MYRIIGGDGREYGPVSLEQIQLWIAQRRAGPATLVRHESAVDWAPLNQLVEFAADLAALQPAASPPPVPLPFPPPLPGQEAGALAATTTPATNASDAYAAPGGIAGAGGDFAQTEIPTAGETPETTKPADDPLDAAGYISRCLERRYELRVGESISRGYDIVARQFGLSLLAVLLSALMQTTIAVMPVIGYINLALDGVFDGGLSFFFLAVARSGRATIGDAFTGFRIQFAQLMLLSLMRALVVLATMGITIIPAAAIVGGSVALSQGAAFAGPAVALVAVLLPVVLVPIVYLFVAWTFAPFLIIDRGLGFWEAMELSRRVVKRRWFKVFFLHVAFLPIHFAGALCFGVGLIYTAALKRATLAGIYEDVFRE